MQKDSERCSVICRAMHNIIEHSSVVLSVEALGPMLQVYWKCLEVLGDAKTLKFILLTLFRVPFCAVDHDNAPYIAAVFDCAGLVEQIVAHLSDHRIVYVVANRVVCNLAGGTVAHRQQLIALGALPVLTGLLANSEKRNDELGAAQLVACRTLNKLCF